MLHALLYNKWGYNVNFATWNLKPSPLVPWLKLAEKPMTKRDVVNFYLEVKQKLKENPPIVAVLTGPYQLELENDFFNIVIDIDLDNLPRENKEALENHFAKEGFVVVSTPRGMHLHFRVPRTNPIYMISLVDVNENKHAGDGAGLQAHMWTSPPSKRPMTGTFFTYKFVFPNGIRTSGYKETLFKNYEPPLLTMTDVKEEIESVLGLKVISYTVTEWEEKKKAPVIKGSTEGFVYKPLFWDMDEFHRKIVNYPLPLPIARVLYNYYRGIGAESHASMVARRNPTLKYFSSPVPHGERFLVSSAFTLFVAHLVHMAKFSEVVEVLSYAIEDFPADKGMPLDRQLRYLLLFDEETKEYIMPRYSGLGALRVPLHYCEKCYWRKSCEKWKAKPWYYVRKFARKVELGRKIHANRVAISDDD